MILLDKPYVSDLLKDTIKKNNYKVAETEATKEIEEDLKGCFLDSAQSVKNYREFPIMYSNTENSLNWINKNLAETKLPKQIQYFKNKALFREILKDLYPDFKFQKYQLDELLNLEPTKVEYPAIIKPAVGFFSMGIYVVENAMEFSQAIEKLKVELEKIKDLYPKEVMDNQEFLIEEIIPGDEYAVDAYFNKDGNAVILNIYEHVFSDGKDVADRLYFSSAEVFEKTYDKFINELNKIGSKTQVSNFPMHIEFRITPEGKVIPIESNPLRFAGWCMTDMAYYAWGINPYEYLFKQKSPNWKEILKDKKDKQYNVVIADIPRDIALSDIKSIDYNKFTNSFSNLLHIHKTDFKTYPVFAFAFSEIDLSNKNEINKFLYSDLREFIVMN
jgi:hypothetical protein